MAIDSRLESGGSELPGPWEHTLAVKLVPRPSARHPSLSGSVLGRCGPPTSVKLQLGVGSRPGGERRSTAFGTFVPKKLRNPGPGGRVSLAWLFSGGKGTEIWSGETYSFTGFSRGAWSRSHMLYPSPGPLRLCCLPFQTSRTTSPRRGG